MSKVLITGVGFQGSHLAESYAKDGWDVLALSTPSARNRDIYDKYLKSYPNITPIWGSINDAELVAQAMEGCDRIANLAGRINVDESRFIPKRYMRTNLKGTQNMASVANEKSIPFIHTSTCEVMGQNTEIGDDSDALIDMFEAAKDARIPLTHTSSSAVGPSHVGERKYRQDENSPIMPFSAYAASKAAGELLCHAYINTYHADITVIRPFNIFGERQREIGFGSVIPIFFKKAVAGETLMVNGDGMQTRDYLYITDLIDAYRLIADTPELSGQVVNVGSGIETPILWLAEQIVKLVGNGRIEHGAERPGEVRSFTADPRKIQKYGWRQKVSVEEGLERYWAWYRRERGI